MTDWSVCWMNGTETIEINWREICLTIKSYELNVKIMTEKTDDKKKSVDSIEILRLKATEEKKK